MGIVSATLHAVGWSSCGFMLGSKIKILWIYAGEKGAAGTIAVAV